MEPVVPSPSLWVLIPAPGFSTSVTSAACVSPSPLSVPTCTGSTQKPYVLSNLALFPEGIRAGR